MATVGYARMSRVDQDLALQLDAQAAAGCAKAFEDRASGARADRPGLCTALDYAREGDVLVTWKLDRPGAEPAAPDRSRGDAGAARRRVPLAHRGDRHNHAWRPAGVPPVRRPRAIRA